MMKKFDHKFVKVIPDNLEENTLYISIDYKTAIHICPCGCGSEIATPISPYDWKITYDGENVSLYPSIGNWGLPCQSHYWITNNEIEWAPRWSRKQIECGRERDGFNKKEYFQKKEQKSFFSFVKRKKWYDK